MGSITGTSDAWGLAFRGIRYAEAPVGEWRFRPPVPSGPWEGVHDATEFGNQSMQKPPEFSFSTPAPGKPDEDSLFLNVFTPATDGPPRPVLFWIHGGAHTFGTANSYDGSVLARQGDVVVVTVNYRLGLFGFLDLSSFGEAFAGSASNGFRDAIAALRWVHDNIKDYGGDPDNVTISGQSAGAGTVTALLGAPSARGLFHRAIVHSGGMEPTPPLDFIPELERHLGLQSTALLERLQGMSAEELLDLQLATGFSGGLAIGVDGVVVTRGVLDAVAERASAGVPVLTGSNLHEGRAFVDILEEDYDRREVDDILMTHARMVLDGDDPRAYLQRWRAAYPEGAQLDLYERVWDDLFRRKAMRLAQAASSAGPGGWLYRFDLPSTFQDGTLGAFHGAEILFTFNTFEKTDRVLNGAYDREDPEVRGLARRWSDAIIAFMRRGDPHTEGLPPWPRYVAGERCCMILDARSRVEQDPEPDAEGRALWGDPA